LLRVLLQMEVEDDQSFFALFNVNADLADGPPQELPHAGILPGNLALFRGEGDLDNLFSFLSGPLRCTISLLAAVAAM